MTALVTPTWPKVVVGFNASDEARDALRLGSQLAEAAGAELHVAVVLPRGRLAFEEAIAGGQLAEQLDEQLYEAAARQLGGADFAPAHLDGGLSGRSAARALYEYARDERAGLIVVGSTHRGTLGRVFPGSVGESLLRGAPCSVAIAPRGFSHGEHPAIGVIGVAYDGSAEAMLALAEAERLALVFGAQLRVITVVPVFEAIDIEAAQVEELREELRREYRGVLETGAEALGDEIKVEPVLEEGDPAKIVASHGVELDLLVIGSRGYGPIRSALLGAISAEVMRTAPCPVLVTPRGGGAAESPEGAWAAAANA